MLTLNSAPLETRNPTANTLLPPNLLHCRLLVLSAICLCLFFLSPHAAAQNQSSDSAILAPTGASIREVRIVGNKVVPTNKILKEVRSRPGAIFDAELLSDDARRIMLMPDIRDVHWIVTPIDEQVDIVFEVDTIQTYLSTEDSAWTEVLANITLKLLTKVDPYEEGFQVSGTVNFLVDKLINQTDTTCSIIRIEDHTG